MEIRHESEIIRARIVRFADETTTRNISHESKDDFSLMTAAIDFGTSNTGFAHVFKGSEEKVLTSSFGAAFPDDRVPTAVLLTSDKTLKSFGKDAVDDFVELLEDGKDEDYLYFENFKMALYDTKRLTRDTEIKDARGRSFKAMGIFTTVIQYIKELVLNIARQTKIGLTEKYVTWIITVPAIWSDSAKQFMREAAAKAGIEEKTLRLVLEPEAASLFCREQHTIARESSFEKLPIGSKYLLADLGGGTVDICVHEIIDNNEIQELYRASGNDLGGNSVNKEFEHLIENIAGEEVLSRFKSESLLEYRDMMRDFERKKKNFRKERVILRLVPVLEEIVEEVTGKSLKMALKEYDNLISDGLDYKDTGKLVVSPNLMADFFKPSLDELINLLKTILAECKDEEISTVFLVGGYAESPYLRQILQKEFVDFRFVIHQDAGLAVLKGAVMMAYQPKFITQRRSRFTYGFCKGKPFVKGKYLDSFKVGHDGEEWCTYLFDKLIQKGQVLRCGEKFIKKGHRTVKDPALKHIDGCTPLFRSTRDDPKYCVEDTETVLIGGVTMQPPEKGWPDTMEFEKHLIVGENEFTVRAINKTTGEEYEAQIDFLHGVKNLAYD